MARILLNVTWKPSAFVAWNVMLLNVNNYVNSKVKKCKALP